MYGDFPKDETEWFVCYSHIQYKYLSLNDANKYVKMIFKEVYKQGCKQMVLCQ